ncbi:MAG: gamma-glutamyltransferase [Rhodospirillales bacterium]|nr:gamma-glutamyltransferase [Rhodospirillales bacterium]
MHQQVRQFVLSGILAGMVAGCSMLGGGDDTERGTAGYVEGFLGGVSADEPRAALVGREILSAGGSATDAAVGMYFTLSVTMPSTASLGGGGVCVVHDSVSGDTKSLNFLARVPKSIPGTATRPSAIPGNPRGFFALHAKYGFLRWEQLVAPAANLARFGTPVSRALSHDLMAAHDALAADSAFSEIFEGNQSGKLISEGGMLTQLDLSTILSVLSSNGPGDFYNGKTSIHLVDAVERAGGSLDLADLREYRPYWEDTIRVPYGDHTMHFPSPPASAGIVAASMFHMLANQDLYFDADGVVELAHAMSETAMFAYADRARWMLDSGETRWSREELSDMSRIETDLDKFSFENHNPAASLTQTPTKRSEDPSGTSFVAVDNSGGAVACSLTMNNLFGTGRIAPGTGIVLATVPDDKNRGPISLVPMIMDNPNSNKFFWAGASSGGAAAPTSLVNVAAHAILGNRSLSSAVEEKRIHHSGYPDTTYYEDGLEQWIVDGLTSRGNSTEGVSSMGLVNAVYCFKGLPEYPESCEAVADPRGYGLSASAE